jgi:excisionase family DNA binding protein
MSEILTASEVSAILKISKRQAYELSKETENPIPSVRISTSVRFRKADVESWVAGLVQAGRMRCPLSLFAANASPLRLLLETCSTGHDGQGNQKAELTVRM